MLGPSQELDGQEPHPAPEVANSGSDATASGNDRMGGTKHAAGEGAYRMRLHTGEIDVVPAQG